MYDVYLEKKEKEKKRGVIKVRSTQGIETEIIMPLCKRCLSAGNFQREVSRDRRNGFPSHSCPSRMSLTSATRADVSQAGRVSRATLRHVD